MREPHPEAVRKIPPMDARDALTIARIVKVNHAGEFGAIRIYSAQIVVSGWFWPDCRPALSEMLSA